MRTPVSAICEQQSRRPACEYAQSDQRPCIISGLATSELSIFLLVSVAELAGLNLTLLETTKTGFLISRSI